MSEKLKKARNIAVTAVTVGAVAIGVNKMNSDKSTERIAAPVSTEQADHSSHSAAQHAELTSEGSGTGHMLEHQDNPVMDQIKFQVENGGPMTTQAMQELSPIVPNPDGDPKSAGFVNAQTGEEYPRVEQPVVNSQE